MGRWEVPVFEPWLERHEVTIFTGKIPVNNVVIPLGFKVEKLFSPVDLNFGKIERWKMAILNRLFIDAHVLFGLEEKLKGFDVAYTAETSYFFTLQCIWAKRRGFVKKVVIHCFENIPFNNEAIWGRKWLKQTVLREADRFIVPTEGARKVLLLEGAEPKKVTLLKPGIDLKRFYPRDSGRGQNDGKVRLLAVSRLVEEKGIKEVVGIFNQLKKKYKNLELKIVGSGEVSYDDMPKIYNEADIFIHYPKGSKTWQEQFGFVLVEAMACGLPIIALDRGSVKEVIGEGGLVILASQFKNALERVIKDKNLRKNLSQKALSFARKNYDVQNYSRRCELLFA